jgi:hypothetical protein
MPSGPIRFSKDASALNRLSADVEARFHALKPLPAIVDQSGGTCGIYALDRALGVRGVAHPPPRKQLVGDEGEAISIKSLSDADKRALFQNRRWPVTSLRRQAKELGISKVGEILSIHDLRKLAVFSGAKDAEVIRLQSALHLWDTVQKAVKLNRAIVFPINGDAMYDAVLDGPDTMAHWITLIGTCEPNGQLSILATQVGRYDLFPLHRLWFSNDSLSKWSASAFDIAELHQVGDPHQPIKVWKFLVTVGDPDAEAHAAGFAQMHKEEPEQFPVFKRYRKVSFAESDLTHTMRRLCLMV